MQVCLDGQSRHPTLWPSFVELGQSQSAQFPCKLEWNWQKLRPRSQGYPLQIEMKLAKAET